MIANNDSVDRAAYNEIIYILKSNYGHLKMHELMQTLNAVKEHFYGFKLPKKEGNVIHLEKESQ